MTDIHEVHVAAILRRIAEFDEFCSTVKNTDPARVWELLRIIKHHAKMMERTDDDELLTSALEMAYTTIEDGDEIEHHGTTYPVCPTCGEEQDTDTPDYPGFHTESGVEVACPSCGASFTSFGYPEWVFTTESGHTITAQVAAEKARMGEAEEDTDV